MLDDVAKLGPVMSMGVVGALILVWDFLPRALLPAPRKTPLLLFALLGPAVSALWTGVLLRNDSRGFAFAGSMVLDDFSIFFMFLFAAIAAAIVFSSQGYDQRFEERQPEYYALVLFASGAMM